MTGRLRLSGRAGSWLTVVGIVGFLTFSPAMLGATQANAIPGVTDCKDAPTPDTPGTGPAYWFLQPPEKAPPAGDAFSQAATSTIYEQYGFAGITFRTYDLGCGGFARDPTDITMNEVSNLIMQIPVMTVAFTGWVLDAAFHPDKLFGPIDRFVGTSANLLRDKVFSVWSLPILVAAGVWLMGRARRRDLGGLAMWGAFAVGSVALVSLLTTYPQAAGNTADSVVSSVVGEVASGFAGNNYGATHDPAEATVANIHRSTLYLPWLSGTFGNANSDAAQSFGPTIFDGGALTWQQAKMSNDDRKGVVGDKQKAFSDAMDKLKDQDESIYEIAQGKNPADRFGAAIVATIGAFVASAFLIVSGLLMLVAFVIVRLGVMLAPVILVLGLFPPMQSRVRAVAEGIGIAVIGCIAFGVGAALDTLLVGQVMAPGSSLTPIRQILLVLLLAVAFFFILRPFLRVHKGFKNAMERAMDGAGRWGRDWRGRFNDDDSADDRRDMERVRQDRANSNRRAEGQPTVPNVVTMAADRGDSRRTNAHAPPHDREAWAQGRQVAPAGQRALPGAPSRPTDTAAREAKRAGDERTPLDPDAIYRPEGSSPAGTMPPRPARPAVRDGEELYEFKPYTAPTGASPAADRKPAEVRLPPPRRPEGGGTT